MMLHSFKINTDIAGIRRIVIKNALTDEAVFETDINCLAGLNTILLNASLSPGNYTLSTDESVNIQHL